MPRRCIFGCKLDDVPMHRFPNPRRFLECLKKWVTLVGGELESMSVYDIYKNKRVCDIHFTDWDRNCNKRLKADTVPSLHLPGLIGHESETKSTASDSDTDIKKDNTPLGPAFPDEVVIDKPATASSDSPELFSWQKISEKIEDAVIVLEDKESQDKDILWLPENNVFMYNNEDKNDPLIKEELNSVDEEDIAKQQQAYKCINCKNIIISYRYTCMECIEYDMCDACEASHSAHYVLRVPVEKPVAETLKVLKIIRKELDVCTNLLDEGNQLLEDNIAKVELLEEGEDEPSGRISPAISLDISEEHNYTYKATKRKPDNVKAQDTGQKRMKLDFINNPLQCSNVITNLLDDDDTAVVLDVSSDTADENKLTEKKSNLDISIYKVGTLLIKPVNDLVRTGKVGSYK